MLLTRFVASMVCIAAMVWGTGVVSGQGYPNKPLRIVTPQIGGGTDFVARLIARALTGPLGQPIIIDNHPSGVIPGQIASKAQPDGYTLLVVANSFWIVTFLRESVPWDPVRDFSPITLIAHAPNILVVNASLPVKSVKELIALAKAKPGELNCAVAASGGASHLAAELFKAMAGVNIVHVPYKGGGPANIALIGGEVHMMFATSGSVTAHLKSGKLRALAVTSPKPSALLPDLPTVAASGLPGYQSESIVGIYAPAKTPRPIINRLNEEIVRILDRADVKEMFLNGGLETVSSSPEQFAAVMESERARLGKVIKDAGIQKNKTPSAG